MYCTAKFRLPVVLLLMCSTAGLFASDLAKAYKYLNTGDYPNALKYLQEAQHDEPDNVAVHFGLAKFYFLKDNSLYNVDSANTYIKKAAAKLPLNPEDKQVKKLLTLGVRDYTITSLRQEINQAAFAVVDKQHTVESYQYYISNFTDSGLINNAVNQRDQLAFIRARGKNNPWALDSFMTQYPDATEKKEAKELFEKLLYEQTTADSSYESYKKYFDQYPQGYYTEPARKKYQEKLVEYYNKKHELTVYLEFERKYKDNPAFNSIQDSIYKLATPHQSVDDFRNFVLTYKNNRNWNDAWDQFYILYTGDGSEESIRKFQDGYPDYPNKPRLNKDIELTKLDLVPVKQGEKYGYSKFPVTDSTTFNIAVQYDEAFPFKCGVAAVRAKPCTEVKCSYYYIDKTNGKAIKGEYNFAGNFDNGYAIAGINNCEVDSCKYGLIDKRGYWFVPPVYDEFADETEGLYMVSKDEKYGFLNRKGEVAISLKYSNAVSFSEGVAAVAIDTNWFFIDATGRQMFFDYFHDVSNFKDSLCAVTRDGDTWGYINKTGTFSIPPAYQDAGDFESGFAIVTKKEKDPKHKDLFVNQRYKIDKAGKIIEKLAAPKEPAKKNTGKKKTR